MTEITNSKRTLYQATYSPIEVRDPKLLRVWDKWIYVATLADAVKDGKGFRSWMLERTGRVADPRERLKLDAAVQGWDLLSPLFSELQGPNALSVASRLRGVTPESLISIGDVAADFERARMSRFLEARAEIEKAFFAAETRPESLAVELEARGFELISEGTEASGYRIFRLETEEPARVPPRAAGRTREGAPRASRAAGLRRITRVVALPNPRVKAGSTRPSERRSPALREMLQWAIAHQVRADEAKELLGLKGELRSISQPLSLEDQLSQRVDGIRALSSGLRRRLEVEPVGFLHLERLSFTPAGIERGELTHSVPLSPGEQVNLSHREWSTTSSEFENIVTDQLEDFSERGVTEKSELSDTTANQNQHSTGFNTGVNVSGGFGPVSISSSVSYNVQDSASRSEQHTRTRTREVTNKASSRAKKEHKISFRLASAAGTEDQRVQTIRNLDFTKATRVDYYQLIRKWRVDLERYGLRLTYDLTIPVPGTYLMPRYIEIRDLEAKLLTEFKFDLSPTEITPENYELFAAQYLSSVESPPPLEMTYINHEELAWQNFDEADKPSYHALEFNVDERYVVTDLEVHRDLGVWGDAQDPEGDPLVELVTPESRLIGASGSVAMIYVTDDVSASYFFARLTARLRPEVLDAWRLKAWSSMRESAIAAFEANRVRYQERINQLRAELEGIDALRLRKIEREEVMRNVLRWMLGPDFDFTSASVSGLPAASPPSPDELWTRVLGFGEFIKFIHNAIEWENMLYFLYPHFWAPSGNRTLRMNLRHPDATHEQFLKAGSARVVLPVRPGFELDFLTLMEHGNLEALPRSHPYVTIAEEMQNYARTNYPGIPSANPSKQGGAWRQIRTFRVALDGFFGDLGRYPTTAEGLESLIRDPGSVIGWAGPYLPEIPLDPWGNAYRYDAPGTHGDYDIVSFGADGQPGGAGDDEDVVSWAEGTLIGSWIEYTPTSALDIAIGEPLPGA